MYSMVCWSPRFAKKEPETEKGMEGVKSALRHLLTFFLCVCVCVCVCVFLYIFWGVGLGIYFFVFVEKAKCRDEKQGKLKEHGNVSFLSICWRKLNGIDRSKSYIESSECAWKG